MNAFRNLSFGKSLGRALTATILLSYPLAAQADIILTNSSLSLESNACTGGVCDPQDGDLPSILGSIDVERMSSVSNSDASCTGGIHAASTLTINSSAGTLSFAGTITGNATADSFFPESPGAAGLGESTLTASVEITETLAFTVSGMISIPEAIAVSASENSIEVEISGGPSDDPFHAFLQGEGSQALSGFGVLEPGFYTFRVFLNSLSESAGDDPNRPPSEQSSGSANFNFVVSPDATPPPTPTPIEWNNPAGGSFQVDANWDPQMVPGSGDTAVFGLQTVYSVDIGAAATERLEIRNGDVTFTNTNYAVGSTAFTPSGTVLDNSVLTLASGTLSGIHILIGESAAARVDVLAGGTLNYTGSLQVGGPGHGSMHIEDGGHVVSGESRIATGAGGGSAELDGPGASWDGGSLAVGFFAGVEANLFVSNGAQLLSDTGSIGFSPASNGFVQIDGDISSWDLTGELKVGEGGLGNLMAFDGAMVTCPSIVLGISAEGVTSVVGFGTGPSVLDVAGQITVGQSNSGSMDIRDGAEASAHDVAVGAGPGSLGTVIVEGPSSAGPAFLSAEENIVLGLEGTGFMFILEDGIVTCLNSGIGVFAGSIGKAELGGLSGDPGVPARWVVNVDLTLGGSGVGDVVLHNSANVTVGQTLFILANGSIGGTGTYSAQTVINGGAPGPIIGSQRTDRAEAAPNGGAVAPGNPVGTLIIDGDYEQTSIGKLTIETTGLGESEFDVLHVTGNATLGGTLEMLFPGAYLPQTGDSFMFLEVEGTISGDFAEVTFPQLLPGLLFDMMQVPGGVVFTANNDAVLAPTFLLNISTRLQVGTDDSVLIGGFILQGTEPKTVLIRAIGPSLEPFGVVGALANPTLELHDGTGALIGQNDNWRTTQTGGVITEDQFLAIHATAIQPTSDAESAIIATLDPGLYTAIVAGANSSTGIGLVEVYDLGPAPAAAKLANISTRGFVQTGDDVMIGGFIIGNQTSEVLVRGIGPSLAPFGISNALADPMLDLHDGNGVLLASNDNWQSNQESEIEATGLAPNDEAESAILRTLSTGAYTAILRGVSDATGVGLVEAYNLD